MPAASSPVRKQHHQLLLARRVREAILDRLEDLQRAVHFPDEIWDVLLELLVPEEVIPPPLPAEPTQTMPGSKERIEVMRARAARGEAIFHPGDRTWDGTASDRLAVAGCRLRNGVARRCGPVLERRHDGLHRAQIEGTPPAQGEDRPSLAFWAGVHDRADVMELARTLSVRLRVDQVRELSDALLTVIGLRRRTKG